MLTQKGLTNRKFDVGDLVLVHATGSFVDVVTDVKKYRFKVSAHEDYFWYKNKNGTRLDTIDDILNKAFLCTPTYPAIKKIKEMQNREGKNIEGQLFKW